MKNDWVMFDFARAFMPDWLARVVTFKTFTAAVLALILLVVIVKPVGGR